MEELMIKTTVRYYVTPPGMAVIKRQMITSVGEDVENLDPL